MTERQIGFDVARALAILAMVLVHFTLVMSGSGEGPAWVTMMLGIFDGRAAAVFIILAGIGVTLMSRKSVLGGDPIAIGKVQRKLAIRGLAVLALGFLNLLIWPGDILRVYGVSLLVASRLITASNRRLLAGAFTCAVGFVVVFLLLDFEERWNWETLSYRGLWTASGLVRNLFYDGFRSVLPWMGYLLFGMWLGRLDLSDKAVNLKVLLWAIGTACCAEIFSVLCVAYFYAHPHGLDQETVKALFGTESMPALPFFLLAAGGEAVAVISLCMRFLNKSSARWLYPLAATGQLALTWYFAHIVLGLGSVVALGLTESQPPFTALLAGLSFFAIAVIVSSIWKKHFKQGPLEALLRAISNR